MRRRILSSMAIALLATACTSRMLLTSEGRTYSRNVQPVTSDQRCKDCHSLKDKNKKAPADIGTYSTDKIYFNDIRAMLDDPKYAKDLFTAEEIQDIIDWNAAGRPDDSRTF